MHFVLILTIVIFDCFIVTCLTGTFTISRICPAACIHRHICPYRYRIWTFLLWVHFALTFSLRFFHSCMASYLFVSLQPGLDENIFFLGATMSGVSFHKHADAWNGVVFGWKRWFMYPPTQTPPGGVWPGLNTMQWYNRIYPKLTRDTKPLECMQGPGDIVYLVGLLTPSSSSPPPPGSLCRIVFRPWFVVLETQIYSLFSRNHGTMEPSTLGTPSRSAFKRTPALFTWKISLTPVSSSIQLID